MVLFHTSNGLELYSSAILHVNIDLTDNGAEYSFVLLLLGPLWSGVVLPAKVQFLDIFVNY